MRLSVYDDVCVMIEVLLEVKLFLFLIVKVENVFFDI